MKLLLAFSALVADALPTLSKAPSLPQPDVYACMYMCPMIIDEVCGDDGNTYANECVLERENQCGNGNVEIAYAGKCECNIACPMIFDPVCGTDGITYGNECALNAAVTCGETLAEVDHAGEC